MAKAEHIGTRIRALRQAKGLTLQQVANEFWITRASVSEWESGRSWPDPSKLTQLAELLGTSVDYLLEGVEGTEIATNTVDNSESNITEWPVGKLPLISWVQAGDWSEIVDNFQPGDAEDWIACPFPSGRHGFVLRVVGDSMFNPGGDLSFRDGDFISVNPERDAHHRSLVIARRNREKATFKQLLLDESDGPMLHALNPNWPTRYIPLDKHTEIIGVVTGQWRPLV
ncbi:helix-turn-helix domain-containing protein [Burkholderia dolosa]|uniref:LexA family protein n=1 Tax=Burkholderia dolosa TaxID=152500 RepID=UPI001BA22966|nr:S24 family peptidase [Burkholderia dolosa]MBR8303711.1 helix-turn-helix domain-containing protein [Burkholderia dolosa]